MKAVMPDLLPDVAESRKRTGADQWGEMRKGVLHMPPMPIDDHQDERSATKIWPLSTSSRIGFTATGTTKSIPAKQAEIDELFWRGA